MRARSVTPVGLSFLDAMTCGLGAVILLFMIINAAVRDHSRQVTSDKCFVNFSDQRRYNVCSRCDGAFCTMHQASINERIST